MPASLPPRFPVIIGPTAGGKSALALEVIASMGGAAEIITADAFQVYRGLDIGTAKPTLAQRASVPHHLIDIKDPGERFTVADWLAAANAQVADVRSRQRLPVLVGGTHLYIKSFLEGMFEGPAEVVGLREELRQLSPLILRAELERVDPQAAQRLHPNDLRRTIRAIEVFRLTGTPISELQRQWDSQTHRRTDCVLIGLEWPVEELNPRINSRVREMVDLGLVEEVRSLWASDKLVGQAREALGYKQLIEALEGKRTVDAAIEQIKIDTRHLAKSQRTWMRRLRSTPGSVWIDAIATPHAQWADLVLEACFRPSH